MSQKSTAVVSTSVVNLDDLLTFEPETELRAPLRVFVEYWLEDCRRRNLTENTIRFYSIRIGYLTELIGGKCPDEVSTQLLRSIVSGLQKERGWNAYNTNHFVMTVKVFFNYLEREGYVRENPVRRLYKLKAEQRLPQPFTEEDVMKLLKACPNDFAGFRDRVMMLVLLDTGVRIGELLGADIGDLDLATGQLRVFGKGRRERMSPFESTVRKALMKYLPSRSRIAKCEALFVTRSGERLSESQVEHRFKAYGKEAGVTPSNPHRWRHTAATWYLRAGGSPGHLQRILGHTSLAMTNRYTHLVDSDAKANHRLASPVESLSKRR